METSKALKLDLLESLGLPYPRARVINHPSQALVAAEYIGFPLVVKPNIGGSSGGDPPLRQPTAGAPPTQERTTAAAMQRPTLGAEIVSPRDGPARRA